MSELLARMIRVIANDDEVTLKYGLCVVHARTSPQSHLGVLLSTFVYAYLSLFGSDRNLVRVNLSDAGDVGDASDASDTDGYTMFSSISPLDFEVKRYRGTWSSTV